MSFTAASLRPEVARVVAECYLAAGNWDQARERILSSNALQSGSRRTAERMELEFRQRLQTLSEGQLILLSKATAEDRAALAWLAAIKHIPFAFEFAAEVLRDKLSAHDPVLRHSDYEAYLELKSLTHPEVGRLTASSREKIRQVLLSMLTEAGLLEKGRSERRIHRPVLSPAVVRAITEDDPRWLAGFLVPDSEIAGL
jgi:2-phosphoglycerate kinase